MNREERRVLRDIIASLKGVYKKKYIRLNSFKEFSNAFINSSR